MKRLFILALIAFAAWYGWNHRDVLLSRTPSHHAVVRNDAGEPIVRLRLRVGGQTFVSEELADGQSADFPFKVNADSRFELEWEYTGRMDEGRWQGGAVAAGPSVMRHIMTLKPGQGVVYEEQNL